MEIEVDVNRVKCRKCGACQQERLEFAKPKVHYTRSLCQFVLDLLKSMTIKDVATFLDMSWDTIKDIQKEYLQSHYGRPRLKDAKLIAIDEISIGSGHKYFTIVLDLVSGAVLHVGEGKGDEALKPFWKKLKISGAKIRAIAMDMSPAFIAATIHNMPGVPIVFDHFHIIKMFNEKLSDLRRDLYREATDKQQKDVIKGTRWLLLKNPENLSTQHNELQRLNEALSLNAPLATAYYLKEDLRNFWKQFCKKDAELFLTDWIARASASGVTILRKFAITLAAHRSGILAWYDNAISTGPLEGVNNKIKTMKRQAYGFRDKKFFILKIFAIHEARYSLVG